MPFKPIVDDQIAFGSDASMFLSIEVLIGSSEILSDKLVAIFMGRATAEREDLVKSVASVTVGGENSTMVMAVRCWYLKTEERLKDKCLLTIGEGKVKSINNGEDLGDDLGDHSDPEAGDKEEGQL